MWPVGPLSSGFSFSFIVDSLIKFSSPPYPGLPFAPGLRFCTVGKLLASLTVSDTVSRLSVKLPPGMPGLYPGRGKPRLVTSQPRTVSSSSQKPFLWPVSQLCLAYLWSFHHHPLTVLLAYTILLHCALWLSSYCSPSAGIQLLLTSWHPTAPSRWLAPLASASSGIVATLLCYTVSWYCTASMAAANALGRCNYRRGRFLQFDVSPQVH